MDSILKNIGGVYLEVFCESIVEIFCHCFERMVGLRSFPEGMGLTVKGSSVQVVSDDGLGLI